MTKIFMCLYMKQKRRILYFFFTFVMKKFAFTQGVASPASLLKLKDAHDWQMIGRMAFVGEGFFMNGAFIGDPKQFFEL